MNPSTPVQDLAAQWKSACRLYPIYFELAREFAIDVKSCADLEAGIDTPGKEAVEQAKAWLEEIDQHVQVHQLRQFLQTSSQVNPEGLLNLVQHFLAKTTKTDTMRDKIDFLLVQYFSQGAPTDLDGVAVGCIGPRVGMRSKCDAICTCWSRPGSREWCRTAMGASLAGLARDMRQLSATPRCRIPSTPPGAGKQGTVVGPSGRRARGRRP